MPHRIFLFDLDGTLIDTAPDLTAATNKVRTDRGLPALDEVVLRPYASRGAPGLLGRALDVAKTDPEFPELRAAFLANYEAAMTVRSRPFDGVVEMLDALRADGIAIGVVTNKYEHLALRLVNDLGLSELLDLVLGSDSAGCAMKPRPDSLLEAARRLRASPGEILYAGDDPRDIEAAHAASMPVAAVSWGYALTPPETWGADYVAHTPQELRTWLLQLNAHAL